MATVDDRVSLLPLICPSCTNDFTEPHLLPCLHTICITCLNKDSTKCPLCQSAIHPLPDLPKDILIQYLLKNKQKFNGVTCANCDQLFSTESMLFCNTCSQSLCQNCRNETHSAKMFSKHEIVDMLSRRLNKQRLCGIHEEPFIMYNTEDKSLICISCFREISISKRSHCLDIESAYGTIHAALGKSIDYTITSQGGVSEAIAKLETLILDTEEETVKRLDDINATYESIMQAVKACYERLQQNQRTHKDEAMTLLQEKKMQLQLILPALKRNLKAAELFASVSDRFDLIELGTYVIERLQSLTSKYSHVQPVALNSNELLDCRKEFAECLGLSLVNKKTLTNDKLHDSIRAELIAYHRGISKSSGIASAYSKQLEQKSVRIDELQKYLNNYKHQVQELHRDITIRRSAAGAGKTPELTKNCKELLVTITEEVTELRKLQPLLENSWKETLNNVVKQQEKYKDRMSVVDKMKNETNYLITLVKQLTPFIHNYKAVAAKLHPKLSAQSSSSSSSLRHDSLNNMHQIIQTINEITPDSEQRIAAIEQAEREKSEMKKNKNPLEEDLQKQKELLRSVVSSSEDISQI